MEDRRHKWNCATGSRAVLRAVIVMSAAATMISCISAPKKSAPSVDYARRIQTLKKQLKKKNDLIEDLKERNLVLEHRTASAKPVDRPTGIMYTEPEPKAPEKVAPQATPQKPIAPTSAPEPSAKISVPAGENGEHFLYSKVIDTYRAHNAAEMKTTLRLLLKTYPDSVFADNALYMAGLQAFEMNDLQDARAQFARLMKDYPRSNKVVSALLIGAEIDKRSGRRSDAIRGYKAIRDRYPGSPEAFRVSVELKLLGQTTTKSRES
ncbi:MAG: tetratricopeptide repeat protein [Bdellovibrionota bacterium]